MYDYKTEADYFKLQRSLKKHNHFHVLGLERRRRVGAGNNGGKGSD